MNLPMRIDIAAQLGEYILSDSTEWQQTKQEASLKNPWFTPAFIDLAAQNIAKNFLDKEKLDAWTSAYEIETTEPKKNRYRNGWEHSTGRLS